MSERELCLISPRAFYNKLRGFNQQRQADFEIVRLQTVELLNIQGKELKQPYRNPQALWSFVWDKETNVRVEKDVYRAKKIAEKIQRIEKRHGSG